MSNDKNSRDPLKKIKSSTFSRGLSIAKMTLNAGAKLASHNIANSFSSAEDKKSSWKNLITSQAQLISTELGELKGSLMKAGQMLSMYGEHFLPAEANAFLKNLQADSAPLAWDSIEKVLKKNLSQEQLQKLEIDQQALSCASLGQVHRARIKATGEEIVLKIQYPMVDKAIDNDLKALRSLLGMLKLVPRDLNLDSVFAEVHDMLVQETNYDIEADITEKFYDHLKDDKRFVVPKVYREFSNKKVLASSYEEGLRADSAEIQNLPDAVRESIGLDFLDLYFKEIFQWGMVQTDPHVGNYRIRLLPENKHQLVLFDFGATRIFSSDFLKHYRRMIKSAVLDDVKLFREAATALNFIQPTDDAKLKALFEDFCFESIEPFLDPEDPRLPPNTLDTEGRYDWKNTDLPQRLSKKVMTVMRHFQWRTPPQEIIFLDRKTGGVFIFMSVLRARCRGRELLLQHLESSVD